MADETANLALPYLLASQAQKHVTLNEGLTKLDALVQLAVESRTLAVQPASPVEGVRYILPAGVTGADWLGRAAGTIAHYRDGLWDFLAPRAGFVAFAKDETRLVYFNGANWVVLEGSLQTLQSIPLFGLNAVADSTTPFFAKLGKALFTAIPANESGSGDVRVTVSKEAVSDVGSLLLQTGFSGRAEMGLSGDDDLTIKVSADGAVWTEAQRTLNATGVVKFPRGVSLANLNGGPLGGYRNRLINGDFAINERQFAGGALGSGAYGHDRWKARSAGLNYSVSAGVVTLNAGTIGQILESPGFAGAAVTVSVEDLANRNLTVTLSASGSGSGSVTGEIASGPGRNGVTFSVPATATGNLALDFSLAAGSGAAVFKKAQIETGAEPTPFEFRPVAAEQNLCKRYFERLNANGDGGMSVYAPAVRVSTLYVDAVFLHRIAKRAAPVLYNSTPAYSAFAPTTGNDYAIYNYAASALLTASGSVTMSLLNARQLSSVLRFQAATSFSGAAGNPCALYMGAAAVIGVEAEL